MAEWTVEDERAIENAEWLTDWKVKIEPGLRGREAAAATHLASVEKRTGQIQDQFLAK